MVDRSRRSVFAEVAVFTAVILGLVVVAASLWSSREERCHTVFVLKQPIEVSLVADAIKHSRADPQEWWHTFPSGVSGGYFAGKEMSAEEFIEGYRPREEHPRITAFRLKGMLPVESLGALAFSIQYRLVVHRSAVVTAPYLEGDPPIHVVESYGTC